MNRKLRINGHSHLLPYPEEIPQFMKDKEIFWVDEERKFMLQKGWKRPVTDSSFFLREKLEWMERNKIDHAVVLNLSQLYGNGLRLEEMKQALRFQNDFNARSKPITQTSSPPGSLFIRVTCEGRSGKSNGAWNSSTCDCCACRLTIWIRLDRGVAFSMLRTSRYSNWRVT